MLEFQHAVCLKHENLGRDFTAALISFGARIPEEPGAITVLCKIFGALFVNEKSAGRGTIVIARTMLFTPFWLHLSWRCYRHRVDD